jgi:hypothetical protein
MRHALGSDIHDGFAAPDDEVALRPDVDAVYHPRGGR